MSDARKRTGSRVLVIAEAGVNHNGSLARALEMVDAAAEAGADAVKFQTFSAATLLTRIAPKAGYQVETTGDDESQYDMLERLELTESDHIALMARCSERHITFLSSPFDLEAIDLLDGLGVPMIKVPSGELTNLPYLRRVGELGCPVILSTGMATLDEVGAALHVLKADGLPSSAVTVLHCTTEYPTPMVEVNLRAMNTIRDAFGVRVGYSDHTRGTHVAVAAVALGAVMIEKHFTLDRTLPGPDHPASAEPEELAAMVAAIRDIEVALGTGVKVPSATEVRNAAVARKSIVAARRIRQGDVLVEADLAVKRPGTGISPMLLDEVVGTIARRDFDPDEPIEL
ncbi:MAG: N-acetylneuraminate synthase [Coriobacteriia bacterium]